MSTSIQTGLAISLLISGGVMAFADFALLRNRLPDRTTSQVGLAPMRWYREEHFSPESRWLARLARRAFVTMLTISALLLVVGTSR